LVIRDEIAYIPFGAVAAFFALVNSRYERCSLILSSNKALSTLP
jgi:DNA replication protein DnaC